MKAVSVRILLISMMLIFSGQIVAQDDSTDTSDIVRTRTGAPDPADFRLVEVINGLQTPLYATGAGDDSGRLFVLEQSGRIWILQNDILQSTPFIDLSGAVSQDVLNGYSERGLLGLAFHPNFSENGYFFVNFTDRSGNTQIARLTISEDNPNLAEMSSIEILLSISQPYSNHNGGHIAFGPDGYLYIAVGDGGRRDDPLSAGQDPSTLLGTILRIDVDNPNEDNPYSIPEDNPVTEDPNFAPEVWAYGLRNVWRFSFDRATGDMYLGDVGQDIVEEINFVAADSDNGINFGWPAFEGNRTYIGSASSDVDMPIAVYEHSLGCSITSGYMYRGEAIPSLQGAFLYSDFCSGRLWSTWLNEDGDWQDAEIMLTGSPVSSFGEDDNGELYLIDYTGIIYRFEPSA